ncbi:MAG: SUMF1/EgtB/PvdO family nonheme iron enzyme [Bryobacterales bacterium]|nr:SUMF1/EgtB/PvdO family nonheme iron enzyme [Bryobacterales bacterium]
MGRALGRLGLDDRKGVGVKDGVPDIDWVRIQGGAFVYQEGERRTIETFHMARYPVTNAQYQAFLDAPDYWNDQWWKGLGDPQRNPEPPRWSEPNHPRETVSWHEAMAFCAWLSAKVRYTVTLPTEWQWERAARGRDGRTYPWGDEYRPGHANISETRPKAGPHFLGRTSPVGIYPMGAPSRPEDVEDLSGNVWEWCLNEYKKRKRLQRGGVEARVLRGGSWLYLQGNARAGYRSDGRPGSRNSSIGFRVVCSVPSTGL